jgi:hypothetical protein
MLLAILGVQNTLVFNKSINPEEWIQNHLEIHDKHLHLEQYLSGKEVVFLNCEG